MRLSAMAALAVALGIAAPASGTLPTEVAAQAETKQDLVRSLTTRRTRSLQVAPAAQDRKLRSLVDSIRKKQTRQITVEERTEVAEIVKQNKLPAIDLEVYFDYDSSQITPAALPKLKTLGEALGDEKLKGKVFMIAGHTDARGSDAYNQSLSERRADAVKQYLVTTYNLDPETLVAIGYGEEQLKNATQPEADQNRRVQVVNLSK